ncbi:sulfur carrier protein ThiS [Reinekea sp.]|jgi:sulfur carrier protein|uniref:sulfur carrier protein ThiS n=1 Tax=Reinekea sp. TaxID=1970455 RepID=UPI002A803A69|nr:MoaD/ThiS family protein [Reinekea sp.]
MYCTINGQPFRPSSSILIEVLIEWGATPPYAVAVNQKFIQRQALTTQALHAGDCIDLLSPIQGG